MVQKTEWSINQTTIQLLDVNWVAIQFTAQPLKDNSLFINCPLTKGPVFGSPLQIINLKC